VGGDALKAVRNEAIAALQAELAALDGQLQPAQAEHAALRLQIEALSPKDLMKQIATDPGFAQQLGLDPQQAKAFAPAADGPLADQGAPKAKAKILEAMDDAAAQAKARIDRFKGDVQKIVDDLNAADDKTKFDAAVDRQRSRPGSATRPARRTSRRSFKARSTRSRRRRPRPRLTRTRPRSRRPQNGKLA